MRRVERKMRGLLILLTLAGASCALPHAQLRQAIRADIAVQPACVRLPVGQFANVRRNGVTLEGFRRADGRFLFPDVNRSEQETLRQIYDLLAELGLYTVEEQASEDSRRRRRHYTPTPLGESHIRWVPGGHGVSGWAGLCYGNSVLLDITELSPIRRAPCEITRGVAFRYRYENIPDWVDDPRLGSLFPDLIDSAEAAAPREGWRILRRDRDRSEIWYVLDSSQLGYIHCVDGPLAPADPPNSEPS